MLDENNTREGFFKHGEFLVHRDALPFYLKGFLTLAYKTGWRFTEISTLQWKQVDRKEGTVSLKPKTTKNQKGRTIYLDEDLKGIIQELWETRKKSNRLSPYVFVNKAGDGRIK